MPSLTRKFRFTLQPLAILIAVTILASPLCAQIASVVSPPHEVRFGEAEVIKYKVGAEVIATRGACRNIHAMVAVPLVCPEQDVNLLDEDYSPHVDKVDYRVLQGGVRQMLISIPTLPAGATARAVVTFEVATRPILPPLETSELKIPNRVPAKLRRFINGSPYIEVRHHQIRSLAKEIEEETSADATDWQKVEAIYDRMLSQIEYVEGDDKSAIDTLRDGFADCQGRSALFIALCRASNVPARMVWVHGHCYPEFYLEHGEDGGSWYPCESAGSRAFGEMPLARTVLQKGDNFRVPERPREKLRYATDFLIGTPTPGGGKPKIRYIREQIFE